ncbi:MAG: hypothetical protein AAGH88_02545 [Planctomycetota bacterium]
MNVLRNSSLQRRTHGWRPFFCIAMVLGCFAGVTTGCSQFKQVQYFEVEGPVDPLTGLSTKSYYRMTVTGGGRGVQEYKMRAAYLSASAIDTLDGKIPTIPAADMDADRRTQFRHLLNTHLGLARERAEFIAESGVVFNDRQYDQAVSEIARTMWAVTLSDSDLVSLGQSRSSNPYEFRKLVFYASARSINLDRYNAQVDSAIQKTETLANLFRNSSREAESEPSKQLQELEQAIDQARLAQQKVDEESAAIQTLANRLESLSQFQKRVEDERQRVKGRVDAVDARIRALVAQRDALGDDPPGEQDTVRARELSDEISRLNETKQDLQTALGSLDSTITAIKDQQTPLNTEMAGRKGKLTTLQSDLTAARARVDELLKKLGSVDLPSNVGNARPQDSGQ